MMRGMAAVNDDLVTLKYWRQTWLNIPFWAWGVTAMLAVFVLTAPETPEEKRTGRPFAGWLK